MNFEELFARRASHIKPGLERIRKSFDALARPAFSVPAVLVGGTNGKGSTSGFIWSLLNHSAANVALYSSPHLAEFSERFQMSGHVITDALVAEEYERLLADLPADLNEELSFFEIATLIGFRLFERFDADFQVLEVGLGGRWDATNISDPLASIVVSVSRDHKEYLGTELLGILHEKFAIARSGRPLFWGAQGEVMEESGLKAAIAESMRDSGAILYTRGEEFWTSAEFIHLRLPGLLALDLPIQGIFTGTAEYLRKNLSIAAAFYQWYSSVNQDYKPIETIWDNFCTGHSKAPVTLVGRAQRVISRSDEARKFLIDVCHNPDGARAFAASVKLQFPDRKIPGYVSILKDKDYDHILDILRSVLSPVILFGIESERTWDLASL
ncbi:MAG: hypothetical protein EOP10_16760, partial [Proteobacteria bacterium]